MFMHVVTPLNSNVATAEEKRKKRESKERMRVQRLSSQGFVVGTRLLDTRSDHLIGPCLGFPSDVITRFIQSKRSLLNCSTHRSPTFSHLASATQCSYPIWEVFPQSPCLRSAAGSLVATAYNTSLRLEYGSASTAASYPVRRTIALTCTRRRSLMDIRILLHLIDILTASRCALQSGWREPNRQCACRRGADGALAYCWPGFS
jgi:hypothetical protein